MTRIALALCLLFPSAALASNCNANVRFVQPGVYGQAAVQKQVRNVRVKNTGFVVTDFAIPVGIPVSVIATPTVLYSYDGHDHCPPCEQPEAEAPRRRKPAPKPNPDDEWREPEGGEEWREPEATAEFKVSVQSIFESKGCANCHSESSAKGGFAMFDDAGSLTPVDRQHVWEQVRDDAMPKGGTPLTDEQKQAVYEWSRERPPKGAKW